MCFKDGPNSKPCYQDCQICFEKSFASSEKSKFWSDLNSLKPWQVRKQSNKKFWFKCNKSSHEFESILSHINEGKWCPYPCCGNQKLCTEKDCQICFDASFSSHEKSKFWLEINNLNHRNVFKSSHKKFWFKCNKSNHEFETPLYCIIKNVWCPYPCCGNKKLCTEKDCQICFDASFSSHEKSHFWSDKNDLKPRNVFKNSNKKFWFKCNKSNHEFEVSLGNINSSNVWCPYPCCGNQKLCTEECKFCFDASFASRKKSQFWSDKNNLKPRNVFKGTDKKFWFKCENEHEFESRLDMVSIGTWCPYCNIWKNQKECTYIIEEITKKTFKQSKPKFLNGLELDCYNMELKLALEYNGEQHYIYNAFFHKGSEENFKKLQQRDKLKQELCKQNNIYLIIVPYWIKDKNEFIQKEYENFRINMFGS